MRISIWIGLLTLAIGILLSYLADAMIATQAVGTLQTAASIVATVLFVLFSASMLGVGIGLVVHWIIGFASHWKGFIAEMILSFATFFVGIGATIMSGNLWTGLQVFFTFFIASMILFLFFIHKPFRRRRGRSKKSKKVRKEKIQEVNNEGKEVFIAIY